MEPRWPVCFKEAFCKAYDCKPENYPTCLFWKTLYPHAWLIAPLLYFFNRNYFKEDFVVIEELAKVRNSELYNTDVTFFHGRNVRDHRSLRRSLGIRVSGKRLIQVKNDVLQKIGYAND
ncbi:MAG: hypothetical protein JWM04_147 [Verrucomicrobiales bacterium]|nr:hypothetical protein [Verrucomicrobiales bacterium]